MRLKHGILLIGVILLVLCGFVGIVSAADIIVPDDYLKIQWAVDNATEGDTIIVRDNIYTENVNVNKSHLTIQSENGPEYCIIQAINPANHVIEVTENHVNIVGFTVKGAFGFGSPNGIHLGADNCNVLNNICTSNDGQGIFLGGSNNCSISNNIVISNGMQGIYLSQSNNNTLSDNNFSSNYDGIMLLLSDNNSISNNICSYNERNGICPWYSSNNEIVRNTLVENGLILYGYTVDDYTNNIDESNTVNGKPIRYWRNIESGSVPVGSGQVILVNCRNVTIENQNLNNASIGIQIYFSTNITIKNNICFNNKYPDDAIRLRYSNDCTISDNNCFDNHHGVDLLLSNNNRISKNNISSNHMGISIQSSNSTYINNNILSENDYAGIYFHNCYRSNITNNFFRNNLLGISMYDSYGNKITLNDFDAEGIGNAQQIYLRGSCNNVILDNILNNYSGLYLDYSSNNNVLTNNKIANTTWGIYLRHGQFNYLNENNIFCSSGGIELIGSSHNTLINNSITLNRAGIEVFSSYYGNCGYNTIIKNNLCCNDIGININGVLPAIPEPNTVYHNDFIDNGIRAYDNIGNNSWDNGYPFGGNYYSDYAGVDLKRGPSQDQLGSDGIGDTSYQILGGSSVDRYPLMVGFENFTIPSLNNWAITYIYPGAIASSAQQTSGGGYIVTGHALSPRDVIVMKLNYDGTIIWQKRYGENYEEHANSIQQTSDGGYIVAGFKHRLAYPDFWILKLNSSGNIEWQKIYGGADNEWASSIQQTSDGGYIVAGGTESFGPDSPNDHNFWVLRLNPNGSVIWQRAYGSIYYDWANSIQQTFDGGFIVTGWTRSLDSWDDLWILKLDSNGTVVWQKSYGGSKGDMGWSIQQTSEGGLYCCR